jgi:hypothetical protein
VTESPAPVPRPQRIAATWFLGVIGVALLVVLWLRGAGRIVVPLVLVLVLGSFVVKAVRAVVRPLP